MSARTKRPTSLRQVADRAWRAEDSFDRALREFLDFFYANPGRRIRALKARPRSEHLARSFGLDVPEWSETHGHALRRPYFAGGLESLKAILTVESPLAFRRRLLFVSKNALSRPRFRPKAA